MSPVVGMGFEEAVAPAVGFCAGRLPVAPGVGYAGVLSVPEGSSAPPPCSVPPPCSPVARKRAVSSAASVTFVENVASVDMQVPSASYQPSNA